MHLDPWDHRRVLASGSAWLLERRRQLPLRLFLPILSLGTPFQAPKYVSLVLQDLKTSQPSQSPEANKRSCTTVLVTICIIFIIDCRWRCLQCQKRSLEQCRSVSNSQGDIMTSLPRLKLGPRVGPYSRFLGFRFPYNPLWTKKGTLFIPRLLLGLAKNLTKNTFKTRQALQS